MPIDTQELGIVAVQANVLRTELDHMVNTFQCSYQAVNTRGFGF